MALIYVVEDDKNIQEIETFALANVGYEVKGFDSAMDFYEALNDTTPDLILLDIMLPDEDGLSIVKKLRTRQDTVLVPVMALLYLGGGLAVILGNLRRLPEAVTLMLRCAVAPEAALGGALGIVTRREALRWGVARSVFSNEAGLGSAAITAACAATEDPVKQGLISMTGVFFDTMVICTVTGLAICCSGVLGAADGNGLPLTGAALTLRAFETVLGPLAPWLIGVALGLFAFTSVLGCAVQAETTASYLLGPEAVRPCRVLYGLAVFAGAVIPMATVLQFADLANALMAFPNLVCLLLLSGEIAGECGSKER